MMKTSSFALAALLVTVAAAAPALSARQRLAQRAVREAIRRQYGSRVDVNFQTVSEERLSGGEYSVTGRGYTKNGGPAQNRRDGRGSSDFDYAVRVRDDAASARDLRLAFADGTRLRESGPWREEDLRGNGRPGNDRPGNDGPGRQDQIRIEKPTTGFVDTDGDVTLSGRAESREVFVTVRDLDGREVARRTVSVRDGRWETTVLLNPGSYRLFASAPGRPTNEADSVSFRVENGPTRDEDRVILLAPSRRNDLYAGNIRFEGTSTERTVRVQLFDSRGEKIRDREANVDRNGRWSSETNLPVGSYRLVLTVPSGRDRDEFDLRVSR